jgi:hypothetical protein
MTLRILSLSALCVATFLTGCETVRTYDGPERPPSEIGRLFTTGTRVNLRTLTLDGKPLTYISPRVLELAPGPHVLEIMASNQRVGGVLVPGVTVVTWTLRSYQKGNYRIPFEVRPGHTYAFTYPVGFNGPLPDTLCLFGEPHDAPGSKENYTKELRTMSPSAQAAGCGQVQNKMDVPLDAESSKDADKK